MSAASVSQVAPGASSAPTGRARRLGTRRSALARTQSETVARALREAGAEVELVDVLTEGDVSRASLASIGGTGVFASALRERLREGAVDLAVHSLKDLPTAPEAGLVVAAVPPREDPRDVLVAAGGADLDALPAGARVGTGSPRRAAQLRVARPDLRVVDVRGNVDTRLRLVADGAVDAVVLARAGLLRLAASPQGHPAADAALREGHALDVGVLVPAPGQGALAVECRARDDATRALLAVVDDPPTRVAVAAERSLLAALEAGCTAPIGALATWEDGELRLLGLAAAPDGSARLVRSVRAGASELAEGHLVAAERLGRRLAEQLLEAGAAGLTGGLAGGATGGASSAATTSLPPTTSPTPPSPLHDLHETAATAPPERAHP